MQQYPNEILQRLTCGQQQVQQYVQQANNFNPTMVQQQQQYGCPKKRKIPQYDQMMATGSTIDCGEQQIISSCQTTQQQQTPILTSACSCVPQATSNNSLEKMDHMCHNANIVDCAMPAIDIQQIVDSIPIINVSATFLDTKGALFNPTQLSTYAQIPYKAQVNGSVIRPNDYTCPTKNDNVPFVDYNNGKQELCMSDTVRLTQASLDLDRNVYILCPEIAVRLPLEDEKFATGIPYPIVNNYDTPGELPDVPIFAENISATFYNVKPIGQCRCPMDGHLHNCNAKTVVCKLQVVLSDTEYGFSLLKVISVIDNSYNPQALTSFTPNVCRLTSSEKDMKIGDRVYVLTPDTTKTPTYISEDAWTDECGYFHECAYIVDYDTTTTLRQLGSPVLNINMELIGMLLSPMWNKNDPLDKSPPMLVSNKSLVLPIKQIMTYLNLYFRQVLQIDQNLVNRHLRTIKTGSLTVTIIRRAFGAFAYEITTPAVHKTMWLPKLDGTAPGGSVLHERLNGQFQMVDNPISTDRLHGLTVSYKLGSMDGTDNLFVKFSAPTKATNPSWYYPSKKADVNSDVPTFVGTNVNVYDVITYETTQNAHLGKINDDLCTDWLTPGKLMRYVAASQEQTLNVTVQPEITPDNTADGTNPTGAFMTTLSTISAPQPINWRTAFTDRPLSIPGLWAQIPAVISFWLNHNTLLVNPL